MFLEGVIIKVEERKDERTVSRFSHNASTYKTWERQLSEVQET